MYIVRKIGSCEGGRVTALTDNKRLGEAPELNPGRSRNLPVRGERMSQQANTVAYLRPRTARYKVTTERSHRVREIKS